MKSNAQKRKKSVYHRLKKLHPVDPTLFRVTLLATGMGLGLFALLSGLFWTQVASARRYGESLQHQSVRRIRVPALRGGLYDRNGLQLVDNRPFYNIVLYIEERRHLRRKNTLDETVRVAREAIETTAGRLGLPSHVTEEEIKGHITQALPLPMELWKNVSPQIVARFAETCSEIVGVDLQVLPARRYLYGPLAAHVIGYVQRTAYRKDQPLQEFDFYLPDMVGRQGVEGKFDPVLRGVAGSRAMLIDATGFRRDDLPGDRMQPGKNLVLSLDAGIQYAVEQVLENQNSPGACVVLDPRQGNVLAMASTPRFDPNWFSPGITPERWDQLNNPVRKPLLNRAVQEQYAPGSIFKIVVALAGLESGAITANSYVTCPGFFRFPSGKTMGCWAHNGHGMMDFSNAIKHSCDVFFYQHGIATGPAPITEMAERFFLGQPTGIALSAETKGILPVTDPSQAGGHGWFDGDTANYAIGQGPIAVTPLQMAVMVAAIANRGRVVWPRLVQKILATDEVGQSLQVEETFEPRIQGELGVSPDSLELVRRAMLRVVDEPDGTGHQAAVKGLKIAGKTGTAEFKTRGAVLHRIWFIAFAPYDAPTVALAIVLENGESGGKTVAPMAGQILAKIFGTHAADPQERKIFETQSD